MKAFIVLLCATLALGNPVLQVVGTPEVKGEVTPVRNCGGPGSSTRLDIGGCNGRCTLTAGAFYSGSFQFTTQVAAESYSLKVDMCFPAMCFTIVDSRIGPGPILPGQPINLSFFFEAMATVPNNVVELKMSVIHTEDRALELCVAAEMDFVSSYF